MSSMHMTRRLATATILGAGAALAGGARAQVAGGDRNINFIVPFSAGSGPDSIARLVAQNLQQKWKQTKQV